MPFTLFHIGPALAIGLPLRRFIHVPSIILASIVLDAESFLVLVFKLRYPLHGYLHTFIVAILMGILLGYIMLRLEKYLYSLHRLLLLRPRNDLGLGSYITAGMLGTGLHVLLDSPLYADIKPFYPLGVNPLYNPSLTLGVYILCSLMGITGLAYYIFITRSPR